MLIAIVQFGKSGIYKKFFLAFGFLTWQSYVIEITNMLFPQQPRYNWRSQWEMQ